VTLTSSEFDTLGPAQEAIAPGPSAGERPAGPRSRSRTFKAAILASGEFLSTLVQLATFAVLARVLSMQDYATYRQTMLAYWFAAPLLMLGLPQALYYFLPGEKTRARAILWENIILLTLMGCVFSLFLLLGGNRLLALRFNNPDLANTLLLLAPYPLLVLPAAAIGACLMARERPRELAVFHVLSRFLTGVVIIAAILIWRTPAAAIVGAVVAAGIILVPSLNLMARSVREGHWRPRLSGMWAQAKFSAPLGLAVTVAGVSYTLDKVIVSAMCTPEQFAIYATGAFEIPLMGVVTGSVTAVLLPDITRLRKEGRSREALALWKRAAVKCSLIILPVMCFLFCMAPEVMSVLFSAKYTQSALPFRLYLLLLPMRVVTFGAMLMAAGKSSLILYRSIVDLLLNLVLSMVLIYFLGYIGAGVAAVLTLYLWTAPYSIVMIARFYDSRLGTVFPYRAILGVLALSVLTCVACAPKWVMPGASAVLRLGIVAPLFAVTTLLVLRRAGFLNYTSILSLLRSIPRFPVGQSLKPIASEAHDRQ
jgi:O-antigen/teichoic acid export membrane protein